MALTEKARTDLLNLGVLTISISNHPFTPMKDVISGLLSAPLDPQISLVLNYSIQAPGSNSTPEQALGGLYQLIDAEIASNAHYHASDWRLSIRVWTLLIGALTAVIVALKVTSQKILRGKLWWDDYMLVIAGILCLVFCGAVVHDGIVHPTAEHLWNVSWRDYTAMLKELYILEIIFCLSTSMSKIALLTFYWTIVPRETTIRYINKVILISLIFLVGVMIETTGIIVAQCMPMKWYDDPTNPDIKCMPRMLLWTLGAIAAMLTNLICLALPLKIVWRLKMTTRQKIMVTGLFAIGILSWAATIHRCVTMQRWLEEPDWTFTQCGSTISSVLETALAIWAACFPAIKALACAYVPRLSHRVRVAMNWSSASATGGSSVAEILDSKGRYIRRDIHGSGSGKGDYTEDTKSDVKTDFEVDLEITPTLSRDCQTRGAYAV